jgi:hypothetical protein
MPLKRLGIAGIKHKAQSKLVLESSPQDSFKRRREIAKEPEECVLLRGGQHKEEPDSDDDMMDELSTDDDDGKATKLDDAAAMVRKCDESVDMASGRTLILESEPK